MTYLLFGPSSEAVKAAGGDRVVAAKVLALEGDHGVGPDSSGLNVIKLFLND
jgi:hypothetical protein